MYFDQSSNSHRKSSEGNFIQSLNTAAVSDSNYWLPNAIVL